MNARPFSVEWMSEGIDERVRHCGDCYEVLGGIGDGPLLRGRAVDLEPHEGMIASISEGGHQFLHDVRTHDTNH